MKPICKLVGVFSIATLGACRDLRLLLRALCATFAVAGMLATSEVWSQSPELNLPDQTVCGFALNTERQGWLEGSIYAVEARKRGLSVNTCRNVLNLFPEAEVQPEPPEATPAGSLAEANLPDATFCRQALKSDRSGWVEGSFAEEAERRGLTFRACDEMNNPPARDDTAETYNSLEPATKEQREFLEAATYFITALDIDPSRGDVVSGTQIELGRYPIVVYLNNDRCVVRLRTTTTPYTVWQFDFCKIRYWQFETPHHSYVTSFGEYDALCTFRGWDKNKNYTGYIGPDNSRCSWSGQKSSIADQYHNYEVWNSLGDVDTLVNLKPGEHARSRRPMDRMIASFKYIVTLLTGKPY
jgi:hypothetical protein